MPQNSSLKPTDKTSSIPNTGLPPKSLKYKLHSNNKQNTKMKQNWEVVPDLWKNKWKEN